MKFVLRFLTRLLPRGNDLRTQNAAVNTFPKHGPRKAVLNLVVCSMLGGTLLACGFAKGPGQGSFGAVSTERQKVKVTIKREADATHFYVENDELCEVTMTFEMDLLNLKGSIEFPYTATFAPGKVTEAFALSPSVPDAKWGYSYTNYYKLGSSCAQHQNSYVYQLPYGLGSTFHVTQAYGGSFSHKGSNKYAIDWKMAEGTLVRAARGGLVVKMKDDSNRGGSSITYDPYNNFVLIRHEDGTLGHYCHLQKGSCVVRPGQMVKTGDPLARSGNTGFSSGPHLHFCVFKTRDGRERESIPVKFRTADTESITLVEGGNYKAGGIGNVSAGLTLPIAQAQGGVSQ